MIKIQTVLNFWFEELKPKDWFSSNPKLDEKIKTNFLDIHKMAASGELYTWRHTDLGRLAEIIVLDQFSRNIFRDSPKAFASDSMALALAQEAIHNEAHLKLKTVEKSFLYMPFMHSESLVIHQEALKHFSEKGLETNYDFELKHYNIIKRFGRYPHRNKVLGRESSSEELDFLENEKDSSF